MKKDITLATWNVNSLRMRWARLSEWLQKNQPDVVCLQEIKLESQLFPAMELRQLGYQAIWVGQKTYNGVAILYRSDHAAPIDIEDRLQDGQENEQARLIQCRFPSLDLTVLSVYIPNGDTIESEKFPYKLQWLDRLLAHLEIRKMYTNQVVMAGDFNIAPDDRDVYAPTQWQESVICHPLVREKWNTLIEMGFFDSLREVTQASGLYTYWDYRQLAFPKNHGLRIDHALVSKSLRHAVKKAWVDRDERKGEKPSDHAPYLITLQ